MNSVTTNLNNTKPATLLPSGENKGISSNSNQQESKKITHPEKTTAATRVTLQNEKDPSEIEVRKPLSESKETKAYLEIISRLEKKLRDNEFNEGELKNVITSLEERLLSFSKDQKKQLLKMEFFKELKIKNLNDMKDSLFEIFSNQKTWAKGINFLKSDPLIAMLMNHENGESFEKINLGFDVQKEPEIDSYTAKGVPQSSQQNSPAATTSIKA